VLNVLAHGRPALWRLLILERGHTSWNNSTALIVSLVLCDGDAEVSLCAPVFLAIPPPPPRLLFALNLPCRLAAMADALLGIF
jgi:hypothetical protein